MTTQEINDAACDPDIYKYGVSQGMFDMPKQRANEFCKELTEQSGRKHDWHYFGGRVHVLALPKSVESLLAEAVARCVVAMRLGDEVEVPDELCGVQS